MDKITDERLGVLRDQANENDRVYAECGPDWQDTVLAFEELQDLRQRLATGHLIELPVPVGGTIYRVVGGIVSCTGCTFHGKPSCGVNSCPPKQYRTSVVSETVEGYEIGYDQTSTGAKAYVRGPGEWGSEGLETFRSIYPIGQIFYTEEEAQKAVEELDHANT